jgi:hypothetical protein
LFIHDFGEQHNSGDWADGDFTTTTGIRFKALGRDMSPLGLRKGKFRPNYAVLDDLDDNEILNNPKRIKNVVDMIFSGLMPALQIKQWWLVVANNRRHPAGILGHIIGDTKPNAPLREGVWVSKVCATINRGKPNEVPAWPERYTLAELKAKFKALGPVVTNREYYHIYTVDGGVFKDAYFRWEKLKPLSVYPTIEGYVDPSFENKATSDHKAVWIGGLYNLSGGGQEYHWIDAFCRQCEFTETFHFMWDFECSLPPGVGVIWRIEKQFFNRPIRDALHDFNKRNKARLSIIEDGQQKIQKYSRIVRMQPLFSNGKMVFNVAKMHTPDMVEAVNQIKGIEPGYTGPDDSPDAMEGAISFLSLIPEKGSGSGIRQGKRKHKRRY